MTVAALVAAKREMALGASPAEKLAAMKRELAPIALAVAHGFIDRQIVVDEMINHSGAIGLIDAIGEAPVAYAIADALDNPPDEPPARSNGTKTAKVSNAHSMEALKTMTFEPIKYVVPGVIVEGLTILAGKPKLGKSWLMLHAAISVASGGFTLGEIHCAEGDVLYCALEDNQRRLQSRGTKLLGIARPWPRRMQYYCMDEVPRLNEGGIDLIQEWIMSAEHPRLIVIDTFVTVRAPKKNGQPSYDADYESAKELQKLANEHGVAIVIVHHQRKMDAEDVFDTVSGTLGLTGVVDTILVLKRDTSGAVILHGRGRDLAEMEKAVVFNKDSCTWTITGTAVEARMSADRRAILDAIGEIGEPASPIEIASQAGIKPMNVRKVVARMAKEGLIKKSGRGKYEAVRDVVSDLGTFGSDEGRP